MLSIAKRYNIPHIIEALEVVNGPVEEWDNLDAYVSTGLVHASWDIGGQCRHLELDIPDVSDEAEFKRLADYVIAYLKQLQE